MAFTATAKDSVREAPARDYIGRLVLPQILSEEFKDYQKLLDDMEVEHTHIALPCIPGILPSSPAGAQNKRIKRDSDVERVPKEVILQAQGASGSGYVTSNNAGGPGSTTVAQAANPAAAASSRKEAIDAFLANPLMPEPHVV
jgi:hypothetical protein